MKTTAKVRGHIIRRHQHIRKKQVEPSLTCLVQPTWCRLNKRRATAWKGGFIAKKHLRNDPSAHESTGSLPKWWADERVNSLYVIIYQTKLKGGKIDFSSEKSFHSHSKLKVKLQQFCWKWYSLCVWVFQRGCWFQFSLLLNRHLQVYLIFFF